MSGKKHPNRFGWKGWVLGGSLVLALNAAYLGAFAEPSLPYIANVLAHLLLGLLLLPFLILLGGRFLFSPRLSLAARSAAAVGYPALLGAGGTGLYLMIYGAIRANEWILQIHVTLSVVALVAWGIYFRCRSREETTDTGRGWTRAWRSTWVAGFIAVLIFFGIRTREAVLPIPSNIIENPDQTPAVMAEESMGGAAGPFFPSSAHTSTQGRIPSNFFKIKTSESCGTSGCHPDLYKQWNSSAHHFSSFNNQWYRKSIEYMQEMIGTKPSRWCGGCHDPAILFNGMMDTPIQEIVDSPEAQAGLGCTACHSIVQIRSTMGQGDYLIEYPPLHDLATSDNRAMRFLHDYVTRLDPEPHRKTFLKPFHTEQPAEFCSACHKVHLDAPVNNYRWLRGFNEYDNWQASGVSGQGARSFYYPPEPMNCVTCHMPLVPSEDMGGHDGRVHSHRFPAANTALPIANQDPEQLEVTSRFLSAAKVTVDLFAITEPVPVEQVAAMPTPESGPVLSSFFAAGEEEATRIGSGKTPARPAPQIYGPLDRIGPVAAPGESVRVELVVRTRGVGHFFPGGTVDAFEVWTEVKAVDAAGKVLLWSGFVPNEGDGPVDPSAHFYRSMLLDAKGNPINKRNAWAARAALYVNLIPPGAADTVHYRLDLPPDVVSPVTLTAKLNYRKFSWWNTQWAFAGVRDPNQGDYDSGPSHDDGQWVFEGDLSDVSGSLKEIPNLPIITLDSAEAQLQIREEGSPQNSEEFMIVPDDRERWNDYGIGLLRQGNLRTAEAAFLRVTEIDPNYPDGWLNVARARLAEGDLTGAQEMLDRAMELDPNLPRVHFFLGEAQRARGEYELALEHYRQVLKSYPRDRVVLNAVGRVLFLQEKHEDAVVALKKVLKIDPEDLQAHYNLMLSYRALGREAEASQERSLYLRFKADEKAQQITGQYRREHHHDNRERQRIHEHTSYYQDEISPAYPTAGAP